jgi:hypothetical protein
MKRVLAVSSLTLLSLVLAELLLIRVGLANPYASPYTVGQLSPIGPYVNPPNPAAIRFLAPKNKSSCNGVGVPLRILISNLSDVASAHSDVYSSFYYLDGRQVHLGQQVCLDEEKIYSNGQQILYNMHLTAELVEGNHTIKVTVSGQNTKEYVWYSAGDHRWICHHDTAYSDVVYSESEVSFIVEKETPSETEQVSAPFPTVWITTAIIASAAVLTFGLVAYFVRRKRRSTS